jgi:UDP-N-acetylmuramoyl-L-alanyl-D-glutamate--2,6-diaminopimelate ligase
VEPRPTGTLRSLALAPGLEHATWTGDRSVQVCGVTLDSRSVAAGDLYAALPGATTHGARFTDAVVRAGAAAILTDPQGAWLAGRPGIPVVVVPDPRGLLGALSAWVYGSPGADMTLIGVTGTNGKTTMSYVIAAALEAAGHTVGIIGTIGVRIGSQEVPSARTTPESPDVHRLLAVMRERGVTAVAMEVSSHALALARVDGLRFDVAVFTNLSQDHLDFHADMEDYFATKASLFEPARARRAVICTDDAWGRRLAAATTLPVVTYGARPPADWTLADVVVGAGGVWTATAVGPDDRVLLTCALPGDFNHVNVLGSVAAVSQAGVAPTVAAAGIAAFPGVPGRMESVPGPFAAFVDYAHTPDAVATALAAARGFATGRILVAMGCGGDRDAGKRALMGRVASEGADVVVVTDDNPRSEDPAVIRQAVLSGAAAGTAEVVEIGDRRAAIQHVVALAGPDDVVLVLGKGHEQGQQVGDVVTPFDDRVVLAEAIAALGGRS